MPPRKLLLPPEWRNSRAIELMSRGSIRGRMDSAAPVKGGLSKETLALAAGAGAEAGGTIPWQSHPDEMPDGFLGLPWYWPFPGEITNVRASCARPPTADAGLDVQLNGSSILASSIVISTTAGLTADYTPTTSAFARDDVLQVIGGTMNGALDITVYVDFTRSTT